MMKVFWMIVGSAWQHGELIGKLRRELSQLVSMEEIDLLLSAVSTETEILQSLGPVHDLSRVARGDMTSEEYIENWGHRGPHEFETSIPRPAEDPDWIKKQLEILENSPIDAETLISRRQEEFQTTFNTFKTKYPRKSGAVHRRIKAAAEAARSGKLSDLNWSV